MNGEILKVFKLCLMYMWPSNKLWLISESKYGNVKQKGMPFFRIEFKKAGNHFLN